MSAQDKNQPVHTVGMLLELLRPHLRSVIIEELKYLLKHDAEIRDIFLEEIQKACPTEAALVDHLLDKDEGFQEKLLRGVADRIQVAFRKKETKK